MGCELTAEEVAYIDRTIADLKAENARLRSCLSDDAETARMIMAENAKLRELLADVFRDFVCCDMALREHGRTYLAYTRYIDRMRELGVEVDE